MGLVSRMVLLCVLVMCPRWSGLVFAGSSAGEPLSANTGQARSGGTGTSPAAAVKQVNDLVNAGRYEAAVELADELYRKRPADPIVKKAALRAAIHCANSLLEKGRAAEAIPHCERAEDYDRNSYRPHFYRGKALARLKRYDEARRALELARERTNKTVVAWSLANVLYMAGDYGAAIPVYQDVLSRGKDDGKLLMNLGTSFWRTGDNYQALQFLKQALEKRPEDETLANKIEKIEREQAVQSSYRTVERGDFTISFERSDEQRELKDKLSRLLKSALSDVERELWRHECDTIQVVLYPSGQVFKEAMDAPNWSAACWDGKLRLPIETARDADEDKLLPILRHELVHFLIRDKYRWKKMPTWLDEGLAQLHEGKEKHWARNLLRKTINRKDANKYLFSFNKLESSFRRIASGHSARMAYAQALWAVKYMLDRRWSYPNDVLYYVAEGYSPEDALHRATGDDYPSFTRKWLVWMRERFHLPPR